MAAPDPSPAAPGGGANAGRTTRILIIAGALLVAIAAVVGTVFMLAPAQQPAPAGTTDRPSPSRPPTPTPTITASAAPVETVPPAVPPAEPPADMSAIDDPSSLAVVVNKGRPLDPVDYEPPLVFVPLPYVNEPYLRPEAADAAVQLFAAITGETGLELRISSSYRSYQTQVSVYQGWVNSLGQAGADRTSARPGHSEHQTGLAMDVSAADTGCGLDCFGDTPQADWVAANAWRFGYVVRYPQGSSHITGYEWEPWHLRYLGRELAASVHDSGARTLEEYFGLAAAPEY